MPEMAARNRPLPGAGRRRARRAPASVMLARASRDPLVDPA